MNISFYTAAVGVQQQQARLDVHGNNIANLNTYGFRAKQPSFAHLMTGQVASIENYMPRGYGSRMEDASTDFRQSGLIDTGRSLDYAIEGAGFFGLIDLTTGEVSYTRDGSFTRSELKDVDAEGNEISRWYLSDGLGRFVLGMDGRRIELDAEAEDGYAALPVGVFDFINHDGMLSLGDNRLIPVEKNGGVGLGSGKAIQGMLELSNADFANEIAKVIESQRSFQYMLRMVTTSDEIETTVNSLR